MKKIICLVMMLVSVKISAQPISSTALLFDGVDDFINVTNPSLFYDLVGATNPFTIEAWIRDDGGSMEQVILSNRGFDNGVLKGFKLSIFEGKLTFNGPSGAWQLDGVQLDDGVCHHIAIVRKANASWDVFIDGFIYPNQLGNPGDINSLFPLYIGAEQVPGLPEMYFTGSMKEIRVWAEARTQNDIYANMNIVINTIGNFLLVDYWRLNEGAGNIAFNSSPNFGSSNFISTISGNATWTTSCSACMVLPQAVVSAGGPVTFCKGGSVILSTPNIPGYSYQWRKYGNDIPGATLSFFTADKSGKYKVVVTNQSGCSKASAAVIVTVIQPPQAVISANGPLSFCDGDSVVLSANSGAGYTYQWRKYSNLIDDATEIIYTATKPGKYKCIVTNSNGCSRVSNVLTVSVPCRESSPLHAETDEPIAATIYPNPSSEKFTLETNTMPSSVKILDISGKEVKFNINHEKEGIYSIDGLKAGFYFVQIQGETMEMMKILKLE